MIDEYIRKASVVRVIDGDTMVVDVDLGFSIRIEQTVRLAGINAPEMIGPSHADGVLARLFLSSLVPPGTSVTVKTVKPNDKYGRYLADVYQIGSTVSVNQRMIDTGHAVSYMVQP